ncbi:MAG: hypothetical protein RI932_1542, partial [Pseudomonadota bacterium]
MLNLEGLSACDGDVAVCNTQRHLF